MTPMDIYQNEKNQLNNSNFSCVIRISRFLQFDWLRTRLRMADQTYVDKLNQLIISKNVFSHEKNQRYGLIVS